MYIDIKKGRKDMDSIIWLIIFLVLLVIEIITLGLTTIWFAAGALVAFATTLFGANQMIQIIVFLAVSVITLVLTRPIAVKYFSKNIVKTNVDELVGKIAQVTKTIEEDEVGEAVLAGESWIAKSYDGKIIKEGTRVRVVEIRGTKLIVEKYKEEKV